MKKGYLNPQLVQMGEQIGKTIKEQEAVGLIGEPSLVTDFELIKQGFVNGLYEYHEMWEPMAAGMYIQNTLGNIQYGDNKEKGEQFLAENALKQGVKVTESGLQYEVLRMGKGPKPTAESTVKVDYEGKLIDGTVFDSSYERGEPIEFPLNGVIKGWTEGLQLMPVGSKFRFYIPQELGYGGQNAGSIPPYSTLIFDVELHAIK
ncbi:MAG: FKBP-type peptidyl-prolyl cis-trans isomerase [Paludibacteraceae bacterium]|nr:FKBP-type peptidyl-prolyl cis-trans isomerase [Paludibacteraceae bacterium]